MSKLSLDKFVELVERSKLVEPDRLAQVVTDWKRRATLAELDDAVFCGEHLVDVGLLTHWQCKKLLEGRHRGFFLGKYRLLDHLGSGGMSSVYLAEHLLMQRLVAVKVLPQNRVSDSSYLARFHFEAQAAAALDHRHIVRVYDLDNEGKIHYLVMEYIEGHDLDALVAKDGPLDFHVAANYVAQAADGLEHAHERGLVHRDIKPANLLVDLSGTVKILDMGLAKFTAGTRPAPSFSSEEHVLGTADYLAPEQAVNSQLVDRRADIYSLGCTLYFLLCGHPPFETGGSLERMSAHQRRLAPSVLVDRPDAPAALVAICRRMMEKSPENRYQTATEVQHALTAWLETEAALGRVGQAAAPLERDAAPGRNLRSPAKSHANLVSGSAPDLTSEPHQVFSPLGDTDPNLMRATVRMPTHSVTPRDSPVASASGSEVLPGESSTSKNKSSPYHPNSPAPPPIAAPPVVPPVASGAVWPATNSPRGDLGVPVTPIGVSSGPPSWMARRRSHGAASTWPWVVLLSALVVVALLLALVAL
jgi:eukaryotic-like serine/threonine-protein kinase